jgi:TPR repeat protein
VTPTTFPAVTNSSQIGRIEILEETMMLTMWKISCRFGFCVLLLSCSLWPTRPARADSGTTQDLTHVRTLAEQGSIHDQIKLAGDYFTGNGVTQDSKRAAYWYEKAAGLGNPEAQNQIGYFYQAGIGVPQDPKRALHWYHLSASSGFAKAKVNLAIIYLRGIGVQKNDELAVRLLTQAFQEGNGTAATYLGLLSYFGIAVKEDKIGAERWFQSALKLHDPLAAYDLGLLYSVYVDHPRDLPKAAALLRRAADAGYVPAMHSLGLLLVNHRELKQNPQQSRTLLETAANAGYWKSSIVLGILARDGRGIPIDNEAAYFHFHLGVLQGGPEADHLIKKDMDVLAAKMGAEDRQTAISTANTWFAHHSLAIAFVYKDGATKSYFPAAAMTVAPDGSFAGQLLPLASS